MVVLVLVTGTAGTTDAAVPADTIVPTAAASAGTGYCYYCWYCCCTC